MNPFALMIIMSLCFICGVWSGAKTHEKIAKRTPQVRDTVYLEYQPLYRAFYKQGWNEGYTAAIKYSTAAMLNLKGVPARDAWISDSITIEKIIE